MNKIPSITSMLINLFSTAINTNIINIKSNNIVTAYPEISILLLNILLFSCMPKGSLYVVVINN